MWCPSSSLYTLDFAFDWEIAVRRETRFRAAKAGGASVTDRRDAARTISSSFKVTRLKLHRRDYRLSSKLPDARNSNAYDASRVFDLQDFRIDVAAAAIDLANRPGLQHTDAMYFIPSGSSILTPAEGASALIERVDHDHEHIHIAAGCHVRDVYFELSTLTIRELQQISETIQTASIGKEKEAPRIQVRPDMSKQRADSTKTLREKRIAGEVTVSASVIFALNVESVRLGLRTLPCEESSLWTLDVGKVGCRTSASSSRGENLVSTSLADNPSFRFEDVRGDPMLFAADGALSSKRGSFLAHAPSCAFAAFELDRVLLALKMPPGVSPGTHKLLDLDHLCCDVRAAGEDGLKWSSEVDGVHLKVVPVCISRAIMYRAGIKWMMREKRMERAKREASRRSAPAKPKRKRSAFLAAASGALHVSEFQIAALAFDHVYLVTSFPFIGIEVSARGGARAITAGVKHAAIGAVDATPTPENNFSGEIECCPPQKYMFDSKPLISIAEIAFEGDPSARSFSLDVRGAAVVVSRKVPVGNITMGLLLQRKAVRTFAKKLSRQKPSAAANKAPQLDAAVRGLPPGQYSNAREPFQVKIAVSIDALTLELEEDGDVDNEFVYAEDTSSGSAGGPSGSPGSPRRRKSRRVSSFGARLRRASKHDAESTVWKEASQRHVLRRFGAGSVKQRHVPSAWARRNSGILLPRKGKRSNVLTITTSGWQGDLVWDSAKHSKAALLQRMRELEDSEFRGPGIADAHYHGFPFDVGGELRLVTHERFRMQLHSTRAHW